MPSITENGIFLGTFHEYENYQSIGHVCGLCSKGLQRDDMVLVKSGIAYHPNDHRFDYAYGNHSEVMNDKDYAKLHGLLRKTEKPIVSGQEGYAFNGKDVTLLDGKTGYRRGAKVPKLD